MTRPRPSRLTPLLLLVALAALPAGCGGFDDSVYDASLREAPSAVGKLRVDGTPTLLRSLSQFAYRATSDDWNVLLTLHTADGSALSVSLLVDPPLDAVGRHRLVNAFSVTRFDPRGVARDLGAWWTVGGTFDVSRYQRQPGPECGLVDVLEGGAALTLSGYQQSPRFEIDLSSLHVERYRDHCN